MMTPTGKVYLVGAGPGDVAYLTVRSQQLLSQAQVLVYDALVDRNLLGLVPQNCHLFNVGKRGGKPSLAQTKINHLLVEQCQKGYQVVRLKSGDPFIFGRTTTEIQALIAANCEFEVIPGISTALAAPLLAGIPLTDPVLSRCFAVATAHNPEELDWEILANIETLVILMGGGNLPEIIHQLHKHGRSLSCPIAIIRWVGHPQQQIWTGTLGNIITQTQNESLSPCVIAIGEVVNLRTYLQIPPTPELVLMNQKNSLSHPLLNKTILVTRAISQSHDFRDLLESQGAKVIEMPTLEIGPPSSWVALDHGIKQIHTFNWLILTSTNGVDYFFDRLRVLKKDIRALAGLKIAVVGQKTAASLKQYQIQPDFIPPNFVADDLVANFPEDVAGKKIMFPRVETGGREVLVKELVERGAEVVEIPAYESRCPQAISPLALSALQEHQVDVVTFASSKTVQYFVNLIKAHDGISLENVLIASIGPQTSHTCQTLFGKVDIEAEEFTLEGLTNAIINFFTCASK